MNVRVLVENTACGDFAGEHGLCLYIEHQGKNYLMDTGSSGLYSENAARLGIDLSRIDAAFLSHAHYDHSGGYDEFFAVNKHAKVYLQEMCKEQFYYKITDERKKYIGIPMGLFEKYEDRFVFVKGYKELGNGIYLCPHTTKDLSLRGKRAHMYCMKDGKISVDDFSHEQSVVFEENGSLYVFNSCSHGGVENIIDEIRARFPGKTIKAFFGGFHMMGTSGPDTCCFTEEEVKDTAKSLLLSSEAIFYTGHCTGTVAGRWLKEVMGERIDFLHSGRNISV